MQNPLSVKPSIWKIIFAEMTKSPRSSTPSSIGSVILYAYKYVHGHLISTYLMASTTQTFCKSICTEQVGPVGSTWAVQLGMRAMFVAGCCMQHRAYTWYNKEKEKIWRRARKRKRKARKVRLICKIENKRKQEKRKGEEKRRETRL